jgi:hypothetical protein
MPPPATDGLPRLMRRDCCHRDTTFQAQGRNRGRENNVNRQLTTHTYWVDTGKKDQGRAFLDKGTISPGLIRTAPPPRTQWPRRLERVMEPTRPRVSNLFLPLPRQTHVPCRSEYTSARLDYGGGPNSPPESTQGCFIWRTPTEIPTCWLKREPDKGWYLGGGERGEETISISSSSSSSSLGDSDSEGDSSPRALAAAQAALLSCLLCFCAYHLSLSAWLASRLTASSGKETPCGSLCTHPRPCMSTHMW